MILFYLIKSLFKAISYTAKVTNLNENNVLYNAQSLSFTVF